ncbi:unnamed protein product [Clavelina lepadiformis]|uniref:Uncharacterized protein n=1 Tax=Clavelina lepadiformis TaxID=159417 RepID=A0ABP0F3B2_CLALP
MENGEDKTCTVHFNRLKKNYGNFDRVTDNPISEGVSENEGKISRSTDPTNNRHQFRECYTPEPEITSTYQLRPGVYIVPENIQNPVQNNSFVSDGVLHPQIVHSALNVDLVFTQMLNGLLMLRVAFLAID